ncbi:hypothetical protein DMENIID0001_168410 [Sergentomyia squamirostris]
MDGWMCPGKDEGGKSVFVRTIRALLCTPIEFGIAACSGKELQFSYPAFLCNCARMFQLSGSFHSSQGDTPEEQHKETETAIVFGSKLLVELHSMLFGEIRRTVTTETNNLFAI